ncbi:MAG TPA: hypothetical protein DIS59_02350 [Candidatus Magasanikbacteria bacterium]|nr:hypothetical protein [Candidatus Magasanikbacteria bacterium]
MKSSISSVLWDVAEEAKSLLPRDFVVRRVLTYGTIGLIIQTIRDYGISYVQGVFIQLKPTSFSKKKYLYLKNYLFK